MLLSYTPEPREADIIGGKLLQAHIIPMMHGLPLAIILTMDARVDSTAACQALSIIICMPLFLLCVSSTRVTTEIPEVLSLLVSFSVYSLHCRSSASEHHKE